MLVYAMYSLGYVMDIWDIKAIWDIYVWCTIWQHMAANGSLWQHIETYGSRRQHMAAHNSISTVFERGVSNGVEVAPHEETPPSAAF